MKAAAMLAVAGALVAAGIALSFYGSALVAGGLSQATGPVGAGESLSVSAELDPAGGATGVYVVQPAGEWGGQADAAVTGPLGSAVASARVGGGSHEGRFEVAAAGEYTLTVSGAAAGSVAHAAVGALPGQGELSVGITGLYLVIAGMVSMAAVGVHAARSRRRAS